MGNNKDPRRNASYCLDLTAFEAIRNVNEEKEHVNLLIHAIHTISNLSGYYVEGRIVLRNKKTGKLWR